MTPTAVLYRSLLEHASLPVRFVRQAHGELAGDVHLAWLLALLAVEFARPALSSGPPSQDDWGCSSAGQSALTLLLPSGHVRARSVSGSGAGWVCRVGGRPKDATSLWVKDSVVPREVV